MTPRPTTAGELLGRLLEATPPPPPDGAALDFVLATARDMVTARDAVLAALLAPEGVTTSDEVAQLAQLEARTRAWAEALATVRTRIGAQRIGARSMRAYAPRTR